MSTGGGGVKRRARGDAGRAEARAGRRRGRGGGAGGAEARGREAHGARRRGLWYTRYTRCGVEGGATVFAARQPARWSIGPVICGPMGHRAGSAGVDAPGRRGEGRLTSGQDVRRSTRIPRTARDSPGGITQVTGGTPASHWRDGKRPRLGDNDTDVPSVLLSRHRCSIGAVVRRRAGRDRREWRRADGWIRQEWRWRPGAGGSRVAGWNWSGAQSDVGNGWIRHLERSEVEG